MTKEERFCLNVAICCAFGIGFIAGMLAKGFV